ncbi:MAG: tryptophan 2,3-dioxygenase [Myxococcota bacterium]
MPRENPADDGAHLDFDGTMSYGDYLQLDGILSSQSPLSTAHDELLFIVQHQTSELWMKLALHELRAAATDLENDDIRPCFKKFTRVARIFEQLNSAWDVLRTMTPSDYLAFRGSLQKSSGFQSYQYREIEFLAGNKNPVMLQPHAHRPFIHARLEQCLRAPSLYDRVTLLLARRGFDIPPELLERDWSVSHVSHPSLRGAWRRIYADPSAHWQLYELAEKLVDFEDYFRRWRFNHLVTVERIIGSKRGTGGTSGVAYLDRMLGVVLFPELWEVRADL